MSLDIATVAPPPNLDLNTVKEASNRTVSGSLAGSGLASTVKDEGDKDLFKDTNVMGKDEFLHLLITSLQHQDPLSPTENQDFIAQMAQFSALENSTNMTSALDKLGEKLEELVDQQKSAANVYSSSSATSLLGKTARLSAEEFNYPGAGDINIRVSVEDSEKGVGAIYDKDGELIREVEIINNAITWDGSKTDGSQASGDEYTIKVMNLDGTREVGYAFTEDRVTGISYQPEGVMLEINGHKWPYEDVVHVSEPTEEGK
jgi:flagellar basal-body rod modification protein FlgD